MLRQLIGPDVGPIAVQSNGATSGVSKTAFHRCAYAVCTAMKEKRIGRYVRLPNVEIASHTVIPWHAAILLKLWLYKIF